MAYCPTCQTSFPEGQFCPTDGTLLQAEQPGLQNDSLLGQVVAGRFRLLDRIGAGGMGTVYRAEHIYINKIVALKLLRQDVTSSAEAISRFQREALAASTIGDDHIVRIDDFGRLPGGQVYLTMEFLDGCPLRDVMHDRVLTLGEVLDMALQTCHGLAAAHGKGIVHRDMKPENIFVSRANGQVKILDFGIAKVIRSDENTNLTKTGEVFGTPNYMAPEQALGKPVDHRADVYSMGVILYEMLTGLLPFRSDSCIAILAQHVTEPPVPPRRAAPDRAIPEEIESVILRAMGKDAGDRFRDMREMIDALLEVRTKYAGDLPLCESLRSGTPAPAIPVDLRDRTGPGFSPSQPGSKVTATAGELLAPVARSAEPSSRTKRVLVAVAALAVLVGVAVLGLVMLRRPDQRGPTAVAPAPVELLVDTEPASADIEVNGVKQADVTPALLHLTPGTKVSMRLSLPGYQPATLDFVAVRSEKKIVSLVKLPEPGHQPVVTPKPPVGQMPKREVKVKKHRRPKAKNREFSDYGDQGSDHGGGEPIEP